MNKKHVRTIIWILLCLALLRGIIYSSVIPFDRSPDESYNFRLIKARHLQLMHASEPERRQAAARLEMITRYLQYPDAVPGKYLEADYADARLPQAPSIFHLYSLVGGWLLKLASLEHIRDEIYLIRTLSTLCGVLVVGLSFLVTWELFPDKPFLLIGVPLFLTFLPQFSAMNGVVSDDKLPEVFLALMFWVLVKIFKHGINRGYILAWFLTVLLALLSKRTAMFVFPLLPVMVIVYYWKSSLGIRLHLLLLCLLAVLTIGGYNLAWYIDEMGGFLAKYVIWVPTDKLLAVLAQSTSVAALKYDVKFFTVIYWSFWGVFGYMDIHLHHFWYVGAACVQCLSIIGLGRWTYRLKTRKTGHDAWQIKVLYLFGTSIVLVVLVMFFRAIILRPGDPMLAQGRRLFTVIIPIGILTVLGLEKLFSPKYHRFVAGLAVAGLLALDMTGLSNYILLNFHRESPFQGVIIGRNENQDDKNREFGIWTPGMTFEQTFTASQENLCRIDFALDSYHAWETPILNVHLYELPPTIDPAKTSYDTISNTRREIWHTRISGWQISPHMLNSVSLPPIPDSQGKHYLFTLEVPEVRSGGSSILLGSPEDRYEAGNFFVNGEQQQGDLAFRVLYKDSRIRIFQNMIARVALQKPWLFSHPAVYYGLFSVYTGGVIALIGVLISGIFKRPKKLKNEREDKDSMILESKTTT